MRYLDGTNELKTVLDKLLAARFLNLFGLKFLLLFDSKKRVSKGRLVLASTDLVNEKLRFLTADDFAPEGYDYIMTVNTVAWENADEETRERIIAHELNHVFIDEKGKLRLVGHDVGDFAAEIQKNIQNPDWALNLEILTTAIYEQAEDIKGKAV